MDDNNNFLSSYKKKLSNQPDGQNKETSKPSEASTSLRYEVKSGFRPARREAAPPPSGNRPSPLVPVLIGAALVVIVAVGLIWYFNRGVPVVNLIDWDKNDAQLWANESGVKLQVEEQYNDKFDAGRVTTQSPAEGETVPKGGFVKITVSLGHDLTVTVPLPDIMSMTKAEVEAWAAGNFMTKVRITAEFSDSVESGRVISYEVNDNTVVGDEVKRNTPVYVIVSKGSEDEAAVQITLPNFREKTVAESYVFANENGILLKVEEQYDDYVPKGSIVSQSVKAAEKVKKGDEITLTVSKGKKITVPDFSEYTKQKATAMATELGIPATIIEEYSSAAVGEFVSQSIEAGSIYESGDVLELKYSLGNKVVLSSFVGQTSDAIETWAKGLNDQGASITIKTTYTQSNEPKGRIIYQDKANALISVKSTVKITVSLGKAVFMPDFVAPEGSGYDLAITREKALAICEELNIIPVFVEAKNASRLPGEVWYQSVEAGAEVSEETTVTLKYTPANVKVTVPNFVNMTEAEIQAGGYNRQLAITFVTADEPVAGYANKVYQQSLPAQSSVAAGSAITLTISPEPPPTEAPTVAPTESPAATETPTP